MERRVRIPRSAPALLFAIALPAVSQSFRFGFKGGVPFTRYFEAGSGGFAGSDWRYSAATRRYTVGATAQWWLRPRLAITGDLLYRRVGYATFQRWFGSGQGGESYYTVKGHSWDFPVLARYGPKGRVGPFLEGGMVLRYLSPVRAQGQQSNYNLLTHTESRTVIDTNNPSELDQRFHLGLMFGGGFELKAGRLSLVPEARFASWLSNLTQTSLRFQSEQVELLLGILF